MYKPTKQYTNHPLMDDIIYNTELILRDICIKNDVLADQYETQETVDNAEIYILIKDGKMTFTYFPFSAALLRAFGYTPEMADQYLNNRNLIPEEDRDALLKFACDNFLDKYVEKNDYYRALNGEPPYNASDNEIIMVDPSWVPNTWTEVVDYTVPLYLQPKRLIAEFTSKGIIADLISQKQGTSVAPRYMYLNHLGVKKIDYKTARKAKKWDILYIPEKVETLIRDRFTELYNLNKDIYLKKTYQAAYQFDSDYYDETMIIIVLLQTFNDMIVDVPEWYIRRDIFDIRSVQYFLDSYGVAYYKQIPLKYQIRLVKNLNKLIKFKSSDQNLLDILDIFDSDAYISKYYLFKERKVNRFNQYVPNSYELEFIKTKMGDSYDNYIKDYIYRYGYDDLTLPDKYWDGEDTHDYIKAQIKNQDFTVARTKYYSIDYEVPLEDYMFQVCYFLGLLMDSRIDSEDIQISVPSIDEDKLFRVSDLFLFIFIHSFIYQGASTDIFNPSSDKHEPGELPKDEITDYRPETSYYYRSKSNPVYMDDYWSDKYNDPWSTKKPEKSDRTYLDEESIAYWMQDYYGDTFTDYFDKPRTLGFNPEADLEWLSKVISHRHSNFSYERGWTLEDLGCADFIVPSEINTLQELFDIYDTNKKCHDYLKDMILYHTDNKDDEQVMKFVYDYLFTKDYDYGEYFDPSSGPYDNLEQLLLRRDYTLYDYYRKIAAETDLDAKQDLIRTILNDTITTLEYYLKGHGVDYVLNTSAVTSFWSLTNYIKYLVDFFKSFKVQFLDPYTTYRITDRLDNMSRPQDTITEFQIDLWEQDKDFARDTIYLGIELHLKEEPLHLDQYEKFDLYAYEDPDPLDDYDYDGMVPSSPDSGFKMADGGVADPTKNVPFVILNGGRPYLGKRDLWDLNGGTPIEQMEYLDVDGGGVFHLEDEEDICGMDIYKYIIDGGSPSWNTFMTRTMVTRVVDRQISNEVLISNARYNAIKVADDGLYIEQNMISWNEFNEWKGGIDNSYDAFRSAYDILQDEITIASDPEALNRRILDQINGLTAGYEYVTHYMKDDYMENFAKHYTDTKVLQFEQDFKDFNPFSWINL
jgi:hypothetical protein